MLKPLFIHLLLFAYEWTHLNTVYKILESGYKVESHHTVFSVSVLTRLNVTQLNSPKLLHTQPQHNNMMLDTKLTAIKKKLEQSTRPSVHQDVFIKLPTVTFGS